MKVDAATGGFRDDASSLPPLIAQAEFANTDVSRVVPLIVAISQGAYAFAPATFGIIRQFTTETGADLFIVAALIQCAAILAFLFGHFRTKQQKLKPSRIER